MKLSTVYLKFTNAAETHNGFRFKTGLNTDTNPFNPDPDHGCGPYGLYFTAVKQCANWIGSDSAYVREVTIPKGEPVVTLADKYRAHRIILGPRHDLSNAAAWKWMVSMGLDVTDYDNLAIRRVSANGYLRAVKYLVSQGADASACANSAVRWASNYGHLDVVKYLVSQGADVTAKNNQAIRWASKNGHLDVVKFLVSRGADATAPTNTINMNTTDAIRRAWDCEYGNVLDHMRDQMFLL